MVKIEWSTDGCYNMDQFWKYLLSEISQSKGITGWRGRQEIIANSYGVSSGHNNNGLELKCGNGFTTL